MTAKQFRGPPDLSQRRRRRVATTFLFAWIAAALGVGFLGGGWAFLAGLVASFLAFGMGCMAPD